MERNVMHRTNRHTPWVLGTLSFVIILGLWESLVRIGVLNPFFTSSPSAIALVLLEQTVSGELLRNLRASLLEFGIGFGLAVTVGVLIGILIGWYRVLDYAVDPFIWFLYSSPLIGFYPVFILIFGLGKPTVIAITFLLSVIPTLVNTAAGIRNVDQMLIRVSRSFGARQSDLFFKVALPASVPMMMAGMRLGIGRALMGVVVAEMFGATNGLGASISYYGELLKTTNMLASLVVIAALGVLATQLLSMLEHRFDSWRVGTGVGN
jgi:NitT/TauT family transport system permease protein